MTRRNHPRTAIVTAAVLAVLAFGSPAAAADGTQDDVLDLKGASALLRVPSGVVAKLAASGSIPGRRVGKEWRFNRSALMTWLQGERYAYPTDPPKTAGQAGADPGAGSTPGERMDRAPLGSGLSLPAPELATYAGRGTSGREAPQLAQAAAAPAAAGGAASGAVGEQPSGPTAEEVALREQGVVLLAGGAATLEANLAYARQVRESFPVLRVEQDTYTATLTGRYGLRDNLQITARLPYVLDRNSVYADEGALGAGISAGSTSESYLGDMIANLQGVALREAAGRPGVILSLDTVLPTGPGDGGLGAGIVLSKSYDPLVIFGGLNYLYGFDPDQTDPRRLLARHNIGFNLGYAYAVNDTIALSGQFAGVYRSPRVGVLPPEKETYLVQLGLTWQLGRGLFVEPSVAFGVGGTAPDFTFSLNLPYTF